MTRHAGGFTLIETLVVVVIVAVLASTVALNFVGADRERNLRTDAERLAALIELARLETVQRNEEWGLAVATDGYRFLSYEPRRSGWTEIDERPFQARRVEDATLVAKVESIALPGTAKRKDVPAILVLSSGEMTPFEIVVAPAWQSPPWIVASDGIATVAARRGT
jgi:general secretion pathway protein H